MIPVYAKELLEGLWPAVPEDLQVTCVVTDSRLVVPGCVFVAIKGERADGHDFAAQAIQKGAVAVVAQRPLDGVPTCRTVLVRDPLDAMVAMGGNYRRKFRPLVLGVTGSVGKTTTKEFCAAVFSAFGNTLKTEGNQNNEIGMPNTLFRLADSTQYAVIEMGMQGLGEIHKLSAAAAPNGAIITKIGVSHLESLGSVENILRAKMEICDGMAPGAPLVLNGDDPLLQTAKVPGGIQAVYAGVQNEDCAVRARGIEAGEAGQSFEIVDKQFGSFAAFIPALGTHNIYNALFAYTAATRLGLEPAHVAQALAGYRAAGMRQNIVEVNGVTLIEDYYNASPESMRAALSLLAGMRVSGKRIAVLGDMKELGEITRQAHKELGEACAHATVDILFTVGELAGLAVPQAQKNGVETYVFETNAEAAQRLAVVAQKGDAVLLKASRSMKFEEIAEAFKQASQC